MTAWNEKTNEELIEVYALIEECLDGGLDLYLWEAAL